MQIIGTANSADDEFINVSEFKDRVAFVTGAGGGIGGVVATLLAERGAIVVATDRDGAAAMANAGALAQRGFRASGVVLDVTDTAAVEAAVRDAETRFGPIQFLANAAGVYGSGHSEQLADAEIERVMAVNFGGVYRLCRAVLPGMMERRSGAIVNMSSLHALNGQPRAAHYAASKAAVLGWTRSLAREMGPLGIRVNAVAPGPIDTAFWRGAMDEDTYTAAKRDRVGVIPLGRLGSASDVAEAIVFLLSPSAAFITGQTLSIGGGEIM